MSLRWNGKRIVAVLCAVASLAACAVAEAAGLRVPSASYSIANPGIIHVDGKFVTLSTGAWNATGTISTAPEANGPWTRTGTRLLDGQPAWSSIDDKSVWAPSVIKVNDRYVAFYAAVIRGETSKRCIGSAVGDSPTGPFTPRDVPMSCIGHGAKDPMAGVSASNSVIDATPQYLTVDGERRLFLTYKTQHTNADGSYYSTIRMVRLNIASNASEVLGESHQLTVRPTNIEENPMIVQRGNTFTLFTSLGGYTLCTYHTEWRQSTNVWSWPDTSHRLTFPAGTNTCGQGNAVVYPGEPTDSWRIFFNGRYPTQADSFHLYVGTVTWPNNQPTVYSIL